MTGVLRRLAMGAVVGVVTLVVAPPLSAQSAPRLGTAGYCPDGNGVTVVVDYQELGGDTEIRCAVGDQATGLAALENAGFAVTGTKRWGKAFVCRINGKPGTDTEPCLNTPPANAYWSYWYAPNNGTWKYSELGASARKPPLGSFEGWSFAKDKNATTNPPPRVAPVRPTAAKIRLVSQSQPKPGLSVETKWVGVTAARWLAGQFVDGAMPGPMVGTDWGLTLDAVFSLLETGADGKALDTAVDAVAANVRLYDSEDPEWGDPSVRISGATAKILFGAVAAGRDPAKFGGVDLRAETLDLVAGDAAGWEKGRLKDKNRADQSNTFGQSLGVLGLARSGGVPQPVVDFLIKQQCPVGGFRLWPNDKEPTCADAAKPVLDPDSTGMAVQALLAAGVPGAKEAAAKGAAWLASIQRPDGSFGGSGPTDPSNTNSTGLGGQALAASGRFEAAEKAAAWVANHQLTTSNQVGAIAYHTESLANAIKDGVPDMQLDQWRRATAQAVLGLGDISLGDLGKAIPVPVKPTKTQPSTSTSTSTATPANTEPTPQAAAAPVLANTGVPVWELTLGALVLLLGGGALRFTMRRT